MATRYKALQEAEAGTIGSSYDYIIVGSGIAGLYAALLAREHGSVLVLTKGSIDDCNTRWAQGGIAAPVGRGDSPEKHLRDTIEAGAGLVDEEAARVLTSEAADCIQDLVRLGVAFDTVDGETALAREGADSVARVPGVQPFLISEAVRGEGGLLLDTRGRRFMPEYDERAELAPRDVVARAIRSRMAETGSDHVLLDIRHLDASRIVARFPQIYRFCLDAGLDITTEPISVSPAAHYTMGGIRTNTWGETTLPGLYACGECACTGVHGANRLASNSLLETVVFARRVVQRTLDSPETSATTSQALSELSESEQGEAEPLTKSALQELMWRDVGIVRDRETLTRAQTVLSAWAARSSPDAPPSPAEAGEGLGVRESQELADMLTCARLATEAALAREESR